MLDGVSSRSGEGAGGRSPRALLDVWRSDSSRHVDDTGASSGSDRSNGSGVRFAPASARTVRAAAPENSDACGQSACHADRECACHSAVDAARADAVSFASKRDSSAASSDAASSGSCRRRSSAESSDTASTCSTRCHAASAGARRATASGQRSSSHFGSTGYAAVAEPGDCSRSARAGCAGRAGRFRHLRTPADQPVPCP